MKEGEFERLYSAHAQGLFGFLAYRTGDRALAEDLLADTFERALRARRRFDPRKAGSKTWIYSIALNLLRDHARRRQAEARALGRVPDPAPVAGGPLERIAERGELSHALAKLSQEEREAIALRRSRCDPRPAAEAALKLNPRTSFTRELVRRFRTDNPTDWKRRARRTRLLIR
jgi:RNA polymerase sigma factor (sigma-70 family)